MFIQNNVRLGTGGYEFSDVEIYALQGKKEDALKALREAFDSGNYFFWWGWLVNNQILSSLHNEPEYIVIIDELEEDMKKQLVKVREVEARLAKESDN